MTRRVRIALALHAMRRYRFKTLAEYVKDISPVDTPLLRDVRLSDPADFQWWNRYEWQVETA